MTNSFIVRALTLSLLFFAVPALAERMCADGKRSYFDACPEDLPNQSRPLEPNPYTPPSKPSANTDCRDCPVMVAIPAGEFWMGSNNNDPDASNDETPRHRVNVAAFALGKYEVTQAQWQAVMGSNPASFSGCNQCPVEQVNIDDIQRYLEQLNRQTGQHYRLPTEAEWEYACRAGGQQTYCGANAIDPVAWYDDNSGNRTHPVGQKQANAWGLYDMSGNVFERTCSAYTESGYTGQENICNNSANYIQVVRGGSWNHWAAFSRAATRVRNMPSYRAGNRGFRLAQDR